MTLIGTQDYQTFAHSVPYNQLAISGTVLITYNYVTGCTKGCVISTINKSYKYTFEAFNS